MKIYRNSRELMRYWKKLWMKKKEFLGNFQQLSYFISTPIPNAQFNMV